MTAVAVREQRFEALRLANSKRIARGQLLQGMQRGAVDPVAVLADPPECLSSLLVVDFLRRCPFVGREKLRRLNMRAARQMVPVNLLAPLGDLSARQREWLARELGPLQRGTAVGVAA